MVDTYCTQSATWSSYPIICQSKMLVRTSLCEFKYGCVYCVVHGDCRYALLILLQSVMSTVTFVMLQGRRVVINGIIG